MLTSSASQYLHPGDYLQPLPTTLDAKKSPLALLAQTCSSIGKDTSPSKPIIPPIEKKDVNKEQTSAAAGRKTASPSNTKSSSSNNNDRKVQEEESSSRSSSTNTPSKDTNKSSFRTPPPKDIPPLVPITPKSDGHKSPSNSSSNMGESKPPASSPSSSHPTPHSSHSSSSTSNSSRISVNCGSLSVEVNHQESTRTSLPPTSSSSSSSSLVGGKHGDSMAVAAAAAHGLLSHTYAGLPFLGAHPAGSLDPAHYSSLAAHSALLAAAHHKPGMSPYVKYATVKTASGATTLVPVCSDPYCSHCKLSMSSAQLNPASAASQTGASHAACGAGCTQCTHEKPPTSLHPHHPLPHAFSSTSSSALSSLYHAHQPFGVLPGHPGLPYICNWVAGSDYCGKRFGTSEELLQHLRSHTSSGDASSAAAAAAAAASLGLPPYSIGSLGLGASALAAHSHFSSPTGSLSPNSSLRAAAAAAAGYPRSLSPNSLLAASRYHPYSKTAAGLSAAAAAAAAAASLPSTGAPGGASSLPPPPPPPSLGAYYPYAAAAALYNQRLGAVP